MEKRYDLEGQEYKNNKGYYYQMELWPNIREEKMDIRSDSALNKQCEYWTATYATPAGALVGVANWVKEFTNEGALIEIKVW